jgi:hypothetical protein
MNLGGMTNGLRFTSGLGITNYFTLPSATGYTYTFPSASGTVALTSDLTGGTVTSVAMSVPTGLSVSGSPITTSGTLAVTLTAGYSIPTTANQSTWTTAYNRSLTSAAVTGTTTKTLTLNQQDGGTITASWTDINTDAVTSVFGRTGAVVATEGDYTLTQLGDVTITSPTTGQVLKYNGTAWINDTDANTGTVTSVAMTVPTGLSIAGSPITSSGTLAVTFAAGYSIPTNASQTTWDTAYTNRITSLTTTGTSGAATLVSNVLNIPQYQGVLTNPITGTGASGQVAYFNGTSSLTSSSNLKFDGDNLGIGGTPSYKLDVQFTNVAGNQEGIRIRNNSTGGYGNSLRMELYDYTNSAYFSPLRIDNSFPGYGLVNFYTMFAATSTPYQALVLKGDGLVGIGKIPDGYNLDVLGNARFSGSIIMSQNDGEVQLSGSGSSNTVGGSSRFTIYDSAVGRGWIMQQNASYNLSFWHLNSSTWTNVINFTPSGAGSFSSSLTQGTVTSSMLKANSSGTLVSAVAGTDYVAPAALSSYVPYTGATANVNLGAYSINASGGTFVAALNINMTAGTPAIVLTSPTGGDSAITFNDQVYGGGVGLNYGSNPNQFVLYYNSAARLQIKTNGYIGIGFTPTAPLQVAVAGVDEQLVLGSSTMSRDISLAMYSSSNIKAEVLRYQSGAKLLIGQSANVTNFSISTSNTERLQIVASGRVLVGSTLPTDDGSTAFQVNGGGKFSTSVVGETNSFTYTPTFSSSGLITSSNNLTLSVPASSTFTNGAVFAASNNSTLITWNGSSTVSNGATNAGFVSVNRHSFGSTGYTITLNQATGIRALAGLQVLQQTGGSNSGTISHGASLLVQGIYPTGAAVVTFTNYYGLLINPLDEWGGVTLTNRWGIYQSGSSDINYFAGNVGIGGTPKNKLEAIVNSSNSGVSTSGIAISDGATNRTVLFMGVNTGNYTYIQSNQDNVSSKLLAINASGGDVVIGATSSGGYKLKINQSGDNYLVNYMISDSYSIGSLYAQGTSVSGFGVFELGKGGTTNIKFSGGGDSYITGGLFGIGQNSPTVLLDLKKAAGAGYGSLIDMINLNAYFNGYDVNAQRAGIQAGVPSVSYGNTTYGQIGFATRGSGGYLTRMMIYPDGNIGVGSNFGGNTTASYQFALSIDSAAKPGGGSWANNSDVRLKQNIKTIENALDKVCLLRGVTFDWRDASEQGNIKASGGFIADEVKEVFPEWVNEVGASEKQKALINDTKIKSLSLPFTFDALIVEALKEIRKEIELLKLK